MKIYSLTGCRCCKFQYQPQNRNLYKIIFNASSIRSHIDIWQFRHHHTLYFSSRPWRQSRGCLTSPIFPAFIWQLRRQPSKQNDPTNKDSKTYRGITNQVHIHKVKDPVISAASLFLHAYFLIKTYIFTTMVFFHLDITQYIICMMCTTSIWTK